MESHRKEKARFRSTKKWREYRQVRKKQDKIDYITGKKLLPQFNLHHMDLDPDHYTDISDDSHFICLNKKSHDVLHFLYNYYIADPNVLKRIEKVLKSMRRINLPK